jgi:hypothetical protein
MFTLCLIIQAAHSYGLAMAPPKGTFARNRRKNRETGNGFIILAQRNQPKPFMITKQYPIITGTLVFLGAKS